LFPVLKSGGVSGITVPKNKYRDKATSAIDEVHLRHLTVDEALLKLDQFLNDAFMAGLYQVRVIHGKGTGTLRQVVGEQLSRHSLVKSYRPGGYGEGGAGVTIVELAAK
jgi:DNA mismatch repair protein MutS2